MFKEGDEVRHATHTGGPNMKVTEVKDGRIVCLWFDTTGAPHEYTFAADELDSAEATPTVYLS